MKEKEIEKLLKLLKKENCFVRVYTKSPTFNEIIGIVESYGDGRIKLIPCPKTEKFGDGSYKLLKNLRYIDITKLEAFASETGELKTSG